MTPACFQRLQRLKPESDELLSKVAFKCNLRPYNAAAYDEAVPGSVQDDESATCDPSVAKTLSTPGMCDLKMTAGNRALMLALHTAGPVAIGVNANNLQFYSSGIIDSASCPPAGRGIQSINHAALVVGWVGRCSSILL